MSDNDALASGFQANRAHLLIVAHRMLGSRSEAEDAVQEAWFRLARTDAKEVANLSGWLTTVVARICLDLLRARKTRGEESLPEDAAERFANEGDPETEANLADSMGVALFVVLDTLAPAERVAFVLHDVFALSFEEIAPIVNRSPAAARQLASRARRRVQGSPTAEANHPPQREIVGAFLTAAREGNLAGLLAILDPDVVLRADAAAVQGSRERAGAGAPQLAPELRGAAAVAKTFQGRARVARLAVVDGAPGLVVAPRGGAPNVVFDFVVEHDRIVEISIIADPASLASLRVAVEE